MPFQSICLDCGWIMFAEKRVTIGSLIEAHQHSNVTDEKVISWAMYRQLIRLKLSGEIHRNRLKLRDLLTA